jgi:acyl-CoA synthetase (AMP-forming)/AMP-acid ligase II
MDIAQSIQLRMRDHRSKRAIEFRNHWYDWGQIAHIGEQLQELLLKEKIPSSAPIGVVAKNTFVHAATILALIGLRRSIWMMHAYQPPVALAADVEHAGLAAVIAAEDDWRSEVIASAKRSGSLGIALSEGDLRVTRVNGLHATTEQVVHRTDANPAVHILTSGTTGKPKNVSIPFLLLRRTVMSAAFGDGAADEPPQVLSFPLSGVGGLCQLMSFTAASTPFSLLERFSVDGFIAAVRRGKPSWISLTPAGLRMILAAEVPPEDLASVKAVYGGSAALEADVQEAFEKRYDCTVYWAYGATEFCGTIIAWSPQLRQEFGNSKRGSVGRALQGVQIRAVDPDTGAEVPAGSDGLLQALVPEIGPDWIKTNDLVSIDSDGFVFHRGRNDGAIVRGGFKILPDTIVEILRSHPLVADAAVVGIPDARLGEVPVAVIETKPGSIAPEPKDLEKFIRERLPATHVPVDWRIVDALPRTSSMKSSLIEIRKMFTQ